MAMFVSILFKAVETQRKTLQIKFFFQYHRIQDPDTKESERNQYNMFPTKQMYFIGIVHSLQYLWVVSYQVRVDKKVFCLIQSAYQAHYTSYLSFPHDKIA